MLRRSTISCCPGGVALAALALAACSFAPEGGGAGPGPDAATDAGVDAPCAPGCSAAGDEAITCAGGEPVRQSCPYGCIDDPGAPVCATSLVPANVDPSTLTTFAMGDVFSGLPTEAGTRIAIDSDLGVIWKFAANGVVQAIRPGVEGLSAGKGFERIDAGLSVMGMLELRVVPGSTVEVFGTRSLVILSQLDVIIDGTLRADAGACDSLIRRSSCGGPGGGRGGGESGGNASGCAPGGNGANGVRETGGGGGGMASAGGAGGTSDGAPGGQGGDPAACADETLVPLAGGGGGGRSFGATGGGGGGGLQITTWGTLRLSPGAVISAVGEGGQGTTTTNNAGGGGGAGGAILLEGATVDVGSGVISVAGGGGGGGRTSGRDGERGRTDGQPAAGGAGDGAGEDDGRGGAGATDGADAGGGRSNTPGNLDGTGGGGGGLGRIRVNSVRGDTAEAPGFTGRFSAGRTTRQR